MFCTACGSPSEPSAQFCGTCGASHTFGQRGSEAAAPRSRRPRLIVGSVAAGTAAVLVAAGAAVVATRQPSTSGRAADAARSTPAKVSAVANTHPAPGSAPTGGPTTTPAAPAPTSSVAAGFAGLYAAVSDGVVRVETTTCDGSEVGSGFLVGPGLVATVAHVVTGAQTITLRTAAGTTSGTVIGYDAADEVALVRAQAPLPGHVFSLAASQPDVGDDVAAIGYPLAGEESLTKGSVSGLHRDIQVEDQSLSDLLQTDTPINPGNSGGPLVTADGTVVGLVEAQTTDAENIGYAVPAADAADLVTAWRTDPQPMTFPGCGAGTDPSQDPSDDDSDGPSDDNPGAPVVVSDESGSDDGPQVAAMLQQYATGIDTGDYQSAFDELSPRSHAATSVEAFERGEASSVLSDVRLLSVQPLADGEDRAVVTFTSTQDAVAGGTGQTCSMWQMQYTLVPGGDEGWLIDHATPENGSPDPC